MEKGIPGQTRTGWRGATRPAVPERAGGRGDGASVRRAPGVAGGAVGAQLTWVAWQCPELILSAAARSGTFTNGCFSAVM